MTEAEWLACDGPWHMVHFVDAKGTKRKLRCLACACCRLFWGQLTDAQVRSWLLAAERYADGRISTRTAGKWYDKARTARLTPDFSTWPNEQRVALDAVVKALVCPELGSVYRNVEDLLGEAASPSLVVLIRDIFGNPFRAVPLDPALATPTVESLARAAFDERPSADGTLVPARLAVLSDALEEAGCADADLLAHLRSPGPHVRGCWAVDLILGKL